MKGVSMGVYRFFFVVSLLGCSSETVPYFDTDSGVDSATDTDTDSDNDTDTDSDTDTDTDTDNDTDTDSDNDTDTDSDTETGELLEQLCGNETGGIYCNANSYADCSPAVELAGAYCAIGGFDTAVEFDTAIAGGFETWRFPGPALPTSCDDLIWTSLYNPTSQCPCVVDLVCL